jgi:UDP-glucose-4-epimerase GalE
MEYVLVTGYGGYIGSHICKELKQQGYGVVGLDRAEPDNWNTYAKYVDHQYECEYNDAKVFSILKEHNIKRVIHTAATSLVGPSIKDPERYYINNVEYMRVFLTLCRDAGVERIVYSSSAATYGDGYTLFDETIVNNPISPYGRTKMIGEWLIEDYCRAYNMSAVALRYFNVCGADLDTEFGQRTKPSHIISVGITRAIRGESITINGDDFDTTDGTCERDYVHVVDVARANVAALTATVDVFSAVNIGSGTGYSNLQIVEAINKYTNHVLPFNIGPARPGDPARLVCNNTKAKQLLGWQPQHSDLETIIKTAGAWHERNTV